MPNNFHRTELNSLNSPLLRLPAEIRSMIFTYVFSGEEYIFRGHDNHPITCGGSFEYQNMGLLLVSRQSYAETALLPYQLGTISFRFDPGYTTDLWQHYIKEFLEKRSVNQINSIVSLQACEMDWGGPQWRIDRTGMYWAKKLGVW